MLWAVSYTQQLDPLARTLPWSTIWSTLLAAVPVFVLFYLLVRAAGWPRGPARPPPPSRLLIAVLVYGMPSDMAAHGPSSTAAGFGLLPVGWTIFNAMLLYNITVQTGQFDVVRRSVASLSGDARIQAILIAFAFGAFLEGAAGGGTPVAICGAIMVGLGFHPFLAAVLCLIANTSPVAYGGLGTPLITLDGVTDILPRHARASWPGISCRCCRCSSRLHGQVHVHLAARRSRSGRPCWSRAVRSPSSSTPSPRATSGSRRRALYPMTDIGGGIFSLVVTALFLRFWKPKTGMALRHAAPATPRRRARRRAASTRRPARRRGRRLLRRCAAEKPGTAEAPLTVGQVRPGLDAVRADVGAADADRAVRQREGGAGKLGPVTITSAPRRPH